MTRSSSTSFPFALCGIPTPELLLTRHWGTPGLPCQRTRGKSTRQYRPSLLRRQKQAAYRTPTRSTSVPGQPSRKLRSRGKPLHPAATRAPHPRSPRFCQAALGATAVASAMVTSSTEILSRTPALSCHPSCDASLSRADGQAARNRSAAHRVKRLFRHLFLLLRHERRRCPKCICSEKGTSHLPLAYCIVCSLLTLSCFVRMWLECGLSVNLDLTYISIPYVHTDKPCTCLLWLAALIYGMTTPAKKKRKRQMQASGTMLLQWKSHYWSTSFPCPIFFHGIH